MTTKPLSSHLEAPTTLLDSISQSVPLGAEIGRGGEGSVFEVRGQPGYVAKVYHKRPLEDDQIAKLHAMVARWSTALESIATWPRSMLFDPISRKPCGILINKITDARQLHELYGTANRRRHFPEAAWHHLVLAARNTAAAFHALHSAGVVVGDVNQGNLMVDDRMCVRMIDCDSFQITNGDKTFFCPVGTPHFTPPELQSQKLSDVVRTSNHDGFGLAVLIFHLLFVGRHPFAGRYLGEGDLSIERAIAERRFAFSNHRAETLVEPPPASLLLSDLPPSLGNLFEAAFRNDADAPRPNPIDWMKQLDALIKRRQVCRYDPSHVYAPESGECPWCRIEDAGGPTFFTAAGQSAMVSADRLALLDERIFMLKEVQFPFFSPRQLTLPAMPRLRRLKEKTKLSASDVIAGLLVASWVTCLAGVVAGSLTTLAIGAALSVVFGILLIASKRAAGLRQAVKQFESRLAKLYGALLDRADSIKEEHQKRETAFARAAEELNKETHSYRNTNQDAESTLVQLKQSEKTDYLRAFLIRDHFRTIRKLNMTHVVNLESYGVETAYDIERVRLYGIPTVGPGIVTELLQWRSKLEREFKFEPEQGVPPADLAAAREMAVGQFKLTQARKVLTGAKQLEALAADGQTELTRAIDDFKRESEEWTRQAKEFRDLQSGRRSFERAINRSPLWIAALSLTVPIALGLAYLLLN